MNMKRIGQMIAQKGIRQPVLAGTVTIGPRRYNLQLRAVNAAPGQPAIFDVWAAEDSTPRTTKAAQVAVGYKANPALAANFQQIMAQAGEALQTLASRKVSSRARRKAHTADLLAAKALINALQHDIDAAINESRNAAFIGR